MDLNTLLILIICTWGILYSVYIIIYEKRSVKSKLIEDIIKLSGYKTRKAKLEHINRAIENKLFEGEKTYRLPKMIFKTKIQKYKYKNMDYYIFNKKEHGKTIFYLHGGSYFDNPLFLHIAFLDNLAKELDVEVVFPIYPKTPFYDHVYSQNKVLSLYKKIFSNESKIILMGDSAGGGFCLSLYYLLVEKNLTLPEKTILLSPWLDVTMTNKDAIALEKTDPQLSTVVLKEMGKLWAGQSNLKDPLVSPLYGNIKTLNNLYLFVGTHEILLPDCRLFKDKCKKHNVSLSYFEYKNMDHVFLLQPIPEAKKAIKKIVAIIKE